MRLFHVFLTACLKLVKGLVTRIPPSTCIFLCSFKAFFKKKYMLNNVHDLDETSKTFTQKRLYGTLAKFDYSSLIKFVYNSAKVLKEINEVTLKRHCIEGG